MKTRMNAHRSTFIIWVVLFTVLGFMINCKKTATTTDYNPGSNEVWMQNTLFTPAELTISVNTKVTWVNKDSFDHTVTSDEGLFDSGNINPGETYSYKFTQSGIFAYHCKIHSGMKGKITVQ